MHEHADHREAFGRYQAAMRPQIDRRQANARGSARTLVPGSAVGIAASSVLMKMLLRDAFTGVLRRRFGAGGILPAASAPTGGQR